MGTVMLELAAAHPDAWADGFDSEEEASLKMKNLKDRCTELAAGVWGDLSALPWNVMTRLISGAEISEADRVMGPSSTKPNRVARAYRKALGFAHLPHASSCCFINR